MTSSVSSSARNFLIYKDVGTNDKSCESLFDLLLRRFPFSPISYINSHQLIHNKWEKATLLVLPGGNEDAYTIWAENLGAVGMKKIQNYVRIHGGKILGICAGAYFVSRESYYDSDGIGLRIREFPIYNGKASGPRKPASASPSPALSPPHDVGEVVQLYDTHSGQRGGCYYRKGPALASSDHSVIAEYAEHSSTGSIAIAHFLDSEGDGEGVVTGVHFEIKSPIERRASRDTASPLFSAIPDSLGKLAEDLSEAEAFRQRLEDSIFEALGLLEPRAENPIDGLDEWWEEHDDGTVHYS